jgi:hypothetical protein
MKREEIIRRRQNENYDEGKAFIKNEGTRIAGKGFVVFATIVMIYNLYFQLRSQNLAILSIFFFYLGCESVGKYAVTEKKIKFIESVIAFIASLVFLIYYIMLTLG